MTKSRDAAFERVFRAEYVTLVAFCFRRVDDYELARDLTAETFRIAWSRWDEPRRSDRGWLYGVARNLIGHEHRARRSHPVSPLGATGDAEIRDESTEGSYGAVEVRAVLSTLPSAHQEMLRLTYWEGLTAAEAAATLNTTPAAVWVRLTRARGAFLRAWQFLPTVTTSMRTNP